MILARIFTRRWILPTILVIAAMAVMARLGIWQLDRLEGRRAFNSQVMEQTSQPVLELDQTSFGEDLEGMEYREVHVLGEYDHDHQIAIRNQYWGDRWGVHLVTPLRIEGTDQAILVDRGWIPGEDFQSGDWSSFNESGMVEVTGIIRNARSKAELGPRSDPTPSPGADPIKAWNFVNIESISLQVPFSLLPVYIQQAPSPTWTGLPFRTQPELELTEGPHMGYAIQWFSFAAILGFGYPFFIRRQEKNRNTNTQVEPASQPVTNDAI